MREHPGQCVHDALLKILHDHVWQAVLELDMGSDDAIIFEYVAVSFFGSNAYVHRIARLSGPICPMTKYKKQTIAFFATYQVIIKLAYY